MKTKPSKIALILALGLSFNLGAVSLQAQETPPAGSVPELPGDLPPPPTETPELPDDLVPPGEGDVPELPGNGGNPDRPGVGERPMPPQRPAPIREDISELRNDRKDLRQEFVEVVRAEYESPEAREEAIKAWREANAGRFADLEEKEQAIREQVREIERPELVEIPEELRAELEALREEEQALRESLMAVVEAEYATEEERAAAISEAREAYAIAMEEVREEKKAIHEEIRESLPVDRPDRPERPVASATMQNLRKGLNNAAEALAARNRALENAIEQRQMTREERQERLHEEREARRQAAQAAREQARQLAEEAKDDTGDRRPEG